jgi:prolipoprotein diacylglyceryltransferase
LDIGPLAIQTPGLILLIGIWIATVLIERSANQHGVDASRLNTMIFIGLIAGLVGARLAYAAQYLEVYLQDPLGLVSLNSSALAPMEGVWIGLLAAGIYAARNQMRLWSTLDALTIGFAFFAIALGFSHLASGDAFGRPTDLPWAVDLWGARRHPTQLYEILLAALIFGTIWLLRDRKLFNGFLFLFWLSLFAFSRLGLEAFRGDSLVMFGAFRQAQVVSLLIVLGAMLLMYWLAQRTGRLPPQEDS